jgi:diguanylate cyclase (GGDEF)-like protein
MHKWVDKGKYHKQTKSMNKSLPRASAILLVCALLVILFNVSTMMSSVLSDKSVPKAIKGEIDLSKIALSEVSSVPLAGNWAFYWEKLLTPSEVYNNKEQPTYIQTPKAWINTTLDGQSITAQGVATYHVNVQTDKTYPHLSLKIPSIGTAYRLYIDNELVSEGGKVGYSAQTSEPGYNSNIVLFKPSSTRFSITVQVSNHDYHSAGLWRVIRLGNTKNIQQEQYQLMIRSAFLLAIFLTVALFNLIQFTLRTADPLPVIIALTCVMLGLREIGTSQILHIAGLTDWSFITYTRISFLTFYATVPLMIAYFHMTFWREYKKSLMAVIYSLCIAASLLVLFTPTLVFSKTLLFFQGMTIFLFMPYVFWGLIQAVRNQRHGARLLILGAIFLFSLVVNDILFHLAILDTTLMVSFGLVAFVLCQNYLTYIRFINDGMQKELLSNTLEERNQELQDFSQSLEEKVAQRTNELAKANEKLDEIAHQDLLTGLPNRRGMMAVIEESMVQFKQASTPFCLLIMDFDRFKQLNDTLGHEVGDRVLSEGANLMRHELRVQDKVARWGGEEFLILLPGTPIQGAKTLAEKIKDHLRENLTISIGSSVSVTIGVAQFSEGDTFNTCFKRADKALYHGKHNGRDQVVLSGNTLENIE